MGKHSTTGVTRRAAGSVLAAGAIPLIVTLIGAGTAEAEAFPTPPPIPVLPAAAPTPVPNPIADPLPQVTTAVQDAVRSATDAVATVTAPFTRLAPALAPVPPPIAADQHVPGTRPVPEDSYLAPQGELHPPVPVLPVAPIEAPPGTLRIGTMVMTSPVDVREVNAGAAQAEAQIATFLDSVGIDRARSDRMAAQTLGTAAVGAAIGTAAAAPVAIPFAMLGAAAGFVAGIPFLPTGLVIGPVLGAAIGYGVVTIPAMIAGAALGGAIGATEGFTAPPFGIPPR
ncbi:hypothetical protein [Nocardia sp. NPDC024068]|uniref:hypothetical protein n=1 Tax=Nocardia sp. NPDC024068 TaxID=3157197 RepID=UPI0033FF859A